MGTSTPGHVWIDPTITINSIDMLGMTSKVMLTAEDVYAEGKVWNDPELQVPAYTKWTFGIEGKQSFVASGSWAQLWPLAQAKHTVVIRPDSGVVSATNPSATFDIYVPTLSFVDAEVGAIMEWSWEVPVIGLAPVIATA